MSTLEVNSIAPLSSSSDVTLGGSSKNIKFASGTTVDFSTNTPTLTLGADMKNTPAFFAHPSGNNGINDNAYSILQANTEVYDTDSAYDTSTYKFTVPSGKGGKYMFYFSVLLEHGNLLRECLSVLYKNGSQNDRTTNYLYTGSTDRIGDYSANQTVVLDLNAGDYISVYAYINGGANTAGVVVGNRTFFGGHRLIGV